MSVTGLPLTKEEVMLLVNLLASNSVVTSKVTNASNKKLKEAAWGKITDHFNALVKSTPRAQNQLRLKWENLKKTARKRNAAIRMNNLKTGGGKPEYLPPDDALDRVASILGANCGGYNVSFRGDSETNEVIVEEVPYTESGDKVCIEGSRGAVCEEGRADGIDNGQSSLGNDDCAILTPRQNLLLRSSLSSSFQITASAN